MGPLRRPDFEQWKNFIYLVIFAVILLAAETTTSPVSSRSENRWEQMSPDSYSIPKQTTRSESLQRLRLLLAKKRQAPSQQQLLADSHSDIHLNLRAITHLSKLLDSRNDELSLLSSYPSSSLSAAESSENLPSFSSDEMINKQEPSYDVEDSSLYDSKPYNVELESYSSPPKLPSASSPSSFSSSYGVTKRQRSQQGSYRYPWARTRSGWRYRNYKRVMPCYLNVVTCF